MIWTLLHAHLNKGVLQGTYNRELVLTAILLSLMKTELLYLLFSEQSGPTFVTMCTMWNVWDAPPSCTLAWENPEVQCLASSDRWQNGRRSKRVNTVVKEAQIPYYKFLVILSHKQMTRKFFNFKISYCRKKIRKMNHRLGTRWKLITLKTILRYFSLNTHSLYWWHGVPQISMDSYHGYCITMVTYHFSIWRNLCQIAPAKVYTCSTC